LFASRTLPRSGGVRRGVHRDLIVRPLFRLLSSLRPLAGYLGYVSRRFPLMRVVLALTFVLLVLEYAVFSLMIPLAVDETSGSAAGGAVTRAWTVVAGFLSLPPTRMTWLWLFLLLLAGRTSLGYVHVLLSTWVSKQVHRHLSERTFRRVLEQEPMAQIYQRSIGYYLTLAGDDTFRAGTIILSTSQTLATLTSVAAGFVLLYLFSSAIFAGTLVFLAVTAVAVVAGFGALLRANARSVEMSSQARTTFVEALNGVRSIRSMDAEQFVVMGYAAQIRRYVRLLFEIDAIRNGMKFLPAMLALVVGAAAVWPGTAAAEGLSAGYFFAAMTLLIRLFVSLGAFINSASMLLTDMRAVTDIRALVGTESPQAAEAAKPTAAEVVRIEQIALRGIRYAYRPGHDVLCGLDVTFRPGEVVALTGPSGSGKSTVADLLLGLIEARAGTVLVNGGALGAKALRRHVVLVEQQARIFSASVRENILLGLAHDDASVWEVLRQVDLDGYVRSLPQGLDSHFEYQGANLSGGQRQRLGIARALIRQPQVLILDEATSALDSETRDRVLASLRQAMRGRIMIFITHDAAVAAAADVELRLGSEVAGRPDLLAAASAA
jgi:ATP-binding cassette subfamily B protein